MLDAGGNYATSSIMTPGDGLQTGNTETGKRLPPTLLGPSAMTIIVDILFPTLELR